MAGAAVRSVQIGGVTIVNTVPAGARAIIGRIGNLPDNTSNGPLLIAAVNPPVGASGVISLTPGVSQNTFFTVALDSAGMLFVRNGGASGQTNIVIDVAGYYL